MESVSVNLSTPIRDFGETISSVTISREATGYDLVAIEGQGEKTATLTLISRLCGLSWEAVLSMTLRDIAAVENALAPFVGVGPQTGGSSVASSPPDSDGDHEK